MSDDSHRALADGDGTPSPKVPRPTGTSLRDRLHERGLHPRFGFEPVPRFSSGSLELDRMLGGGLPIGKVVNFWGTESVGKSTISQVIAGAVVRNDDLGTDDAPGGMVALVDTENSYDPTWAYRLGVTKPDNLHLFQPDTGEEALDTVTELAQMTYTDDVTGEVRCIYDLIILDAIGMLAFADEFEGRAADAHVGVGARKLSNWIRPLKYTLRRYKATLLTINHVTFKIGVAFGDPETQPGGQKLRHANDIEVYFNTPVRNPASIDSPLQGMTFHMLARKNKTAVAKRRAFVYVQLEEDTFGVDIVRELAGGKVGSRTTPGLLKDFEILRNANNQPYHSGAMYYETENGELVPVQTKTTSGLMHAKTKKDLDRVLREDPFWRATMIGRVYEAIQYENSEDGIRAMMAAGEMPWAVENDALPEDEPELAGAT